MPSGALRPDHPVTTATVPGDTRDRIHKPRNKEATISTLVFLTILVKQFLFPLFHFCCSPTRVELIRSLTYRTRLLLRFSINERYKPMIAETLLVSKTSLP